MKFFFLALELAGISLMLASVYLLILISEIL